MPSGAVEDRINHNAHPILEVDSAFLCDDGVRVVN